MAIYFGSNGLVELKRDTTSQGLVTLLDPSDVNVTKKRFSVDFQSNSLITGDQVEIETVDGSTLELVSGHSFPDVKKFINVDEVGGIRLYNNFENALSGGLANATTLVEPSSSKEVRITTHNDRYRCVANIKEYEITTTRDSVDLTNLGEEFKSQFDRGLISGQGTMTCLWQHQYLICDPHYTTNAPEFPAYLAQLILRMEQGADFAAEFYIYYSGTTSVASVWYEAECLVSNVVVSVPTEGLISTKIDFVTTGPFHLRSGTPVFNLLQEDGALLLEEDGDKITIEDTD